MFPNPKQFHQTKTSRSFEINGLEEVFILLFPRRITNTCFGNIVLRVSKVRLFKDSIGLLVHDKKKDGKPKIAGEKVFQQNCLEFLTLGFSD